MKKFIYSIALLFSIGLFQPAVSSAQTGKETALESLGSLAGLLMYNTYTSIGSIGDAYESSVYEADYVSDVMEELKGGMGAVISQMESLMTSGFLTDPADKEFMRDVIDTFELLSKQANALKNYALSKSETDADLFQDYRSQAWDNISELLGLED